MNLVIIKQSKGKQMLKYSKQTKLELSNDQSLTIIYSFNSVVFYESFEYLLDFIYLNEEIAKDLMITILNHLTTPTTTFSIKTL